jgi:hypothetical protein
MHQRAALQPGENRRVEFLGQRLVVPQHQPAARAAQRLVRGGGGDMRVRHRRGMHAAGDEAGEMRHVHHQIGADMIGDLAKALEIPRPRIGRAAGDDQLRLHLLGAARDFIHVDELVVAAHGVVLRIEPSSGNIHRRAVGEMAAGGEIEAHERIAGSKQRQKYRLVHLAAGIGLHIGESGAEQLFGALDRQRLHHVDEFTAAVIAGAGIAFGIFVGQHRTLRLQHRAADDVFRRNQLDLMALAAEFAADGGGDIRIGLGEGGCEERVGRGSGPGGRGSRGHGRISPPPQALGRASGRFWLAVESGVRRLAYRGWQAKRLRLMPGIYARCGGDASVSEGCRSPDAAQHAALRGVVRCRAGVVPERGVWYGPGSAERHKNAAPRPGNGTLLRESIRPALLDRALERRPRVHALKPRAQIRIRRYPVEHLRQLGHKTHLDIRA